MDVDGDIVSIVFDDDIDDDIVDDMNWVGSVVVDELDVVDDGDIDVILDSLSVVC